MLSKTAEYALRVVTWLAGGSRSEPAARLAHQTKVPRRYLQKVLQDLVAAELVTSRSGPGGGYALARPADQITILDVLNGVDPLQRIRSCPLGLTSHASLCPLHAELDKAFAATEAAFSQVTIQDVVQSTSRILPLCETTPYSKSDTDHLAGEKSDEILDCCCES